MKRCKHVWRWVTPHIITIGAWSEDFLDKDTWNVWCDKCSTHAWAHRG